MPARSLTKWTYSRAGVDLRARGTALAALLRGIRYTPSSRTQRGLPGGGHYAGFVRAGAETIAITTDTVGTKVLVAELIGRWLEVGEDIVGVNVNDLAAVGARPIGLVDCISCRRPNPLIFAQLGRGIDRGLRAAGCGLLGGETAVVPDLVTSIDLGGTAIGHFPKGRRPMTGVGVRPGDVVIGIRANGFHANGFTLIRRLLRARSVDLRRPRPGGRKALGRELLTPTRIYVRASEALADADSTHGFAHITGGGVRNLIRLQHNVAFVLDSWPAPRGIYEWMADFGNIDPTELFQTFNMGIGFVAIVTPDYVRTALQRLARAGYPDARPVGRVAGGRGVHLPQFGVKYTDYA